MNWPWTWDARAHGWHCVDGRDVYGPMPEHPKRSASMAQQLTPEARAARAALVAAKRAEKTRAIPLIDPWRAKA